MILFYELNVRRQKNIFSLNHFSILCGSALQGYA